MTLSIHANRDDRWNFQKVIQIYFTICLFICNILNVQQCIFLIPFFVFEESISSGKIYTIVVHDIYTNQKP